MLDDIYHSLYSLPCTLCQDISQVGLGLGVWWETFIHFSFVAHHVYLIKYRSRLFLFSGQGGLRGRAQGWVALQGGARFAFVALTS